MRRRWRFLLAQLIWTIAVIGAGASMGLPTNPEQGIALGLVLFAITGFILRWGEASQHTESRESAQVGVRAVASSFMWLIYVAAVMFGLEEVGAVIIPIAFILIVPLLALSAFLWDIPGKRLGIRLEERALEREKRKRDRLDSVLRDLSDDDLLRLKQRLSDGEISDDHLYDMIVGDDGELVQHQ